LFYEIDVVDDGYKIAAAAMKTHLFEREKNWIGGIIRKRRMVVIITPTHFHLLQKAKKIIQFSDE
jgi:hypothetical protein